MSGNKEQGTGNGEQEASDPVPRSSFHVPGEGSGGLDLASKRKITSLYERSLRQYGHTVRALRWNSEHSQRARFAVLLEAALAVGWNGASVADIGCGLGDLYGYLQERDIQADYTGYDIVTAMAAAAKEKYPAGRFAVRDILQDGLGGEFDFVVASGTFNIRVAQHDRFLRRILAVMYAGCRRAVAFNLLALSPFREISGNELYYEAEPEDILTYCRTLCDRVELREGYLAWDFTVFMYKEPPMLSS